jgi:hypothetical protein
MSGQSPHKPTDFDVIVVVSGSPVPAHVKSNQTLEHLVHDALKESGNVGQPPADWELRTQSGALLAQSERAGDAGLHEGETLFLNPRAGAGG